MPGPEIICLGEPMVEFVREGDQDSETYRIGVGGDTSNAAIAAARQGASVGYLTALGADRFGDRIIRLWSNEGVDASCVHRDPDAQTGLYLIEPDPADRHFTYYRDGSAASRYGAEHLPSGYLETAKILHLSGITLAVSDQLRATALEAIKRVRAAGGRVCLDTNLRLKLWDVQTARSVIEATARQTTLIVTSIEDSESLTGLSDPKAIAEHYSGLGAEVVVVTLGAEGASLSVGRRTEQIPPAPASPVDSTGAGDSFTGSFLAWWLETGDPWQAGRMAAIVAAGTVSGLGAVDPIPRREDVLESARGLGLDV